MVMSALFGTTGVSLVFLPRWLEVERNLSGVEIGAIISLSQFARIVTGPLIAYRADRPGGYSDIAQYIGYVIKSGKVAGIGIGETSVQTAH